MKKADVIGLRRGVILSTVIALLVMLIMIVHALAGEARRDIYDRNHAYLGYCVRVNNGEDCYDRNGKLLTRMRETREGTRIIQRLYDRNMRFLGTQTIKGD